MVSCVRGSLGGAPVSGFCLINAIGINLCLCAILQWDMMTNAERKEKLDYLVDAGDTNVTVLDDGYRFRFWNKKGEVLLAYFHSHGEFVSLDGHHSDLDEVDRKLFRVWKETKKEQEFCDRVLTPEQVKTLGLLLAAGGQATIDLYRCDSDITCEFRIENTKIWFSQDTCDEDSKPGDAYIHDKFDSMGYPDTYFKRIKELMPKAQSAMKNLQGFIKEMIQLDKDND